MKIVTVEYKRLRNLGNYENETVGASAQVEDGETPEEALEKLKVFVADKLLAKQREIEFKTELEVADTEAERLAARQAKQSKVDNQWQKLQTIARVDQELHENNRKLMNKPEPSLAEMLAKRLSDDEPPF
jgi:hypothetical protein